MKELISITDYSNFINEVLDKSIIKYRIKKAVEENIIIEDDESPVEEEKCGNPKYISELPGDLRSNDESLLIDRFDACTTKMAEVKLEINSLKSDLEDVVKKAVVNREELKEGLDELGSMALDNQKFYDADDKVRDEKNNLLDDIIERAGENNIVEYDDSGTIDNDILKIKDLLKDSSWIDNDDQDFINNVSDRLHKLGDDLAEDNDGDISFKPIHDIADDLKLIASNDSFDKNLPDLHKNLHVIDLFEQLDKVDKLQKEVNKNIDTVEDLGVKVENLNNEYMDYFNESINTAQRMRDIGGLN